MRKNYNPYLLPKPVRRIRFYCRAIILPILVFQGIRTLIIPTTGDVIFFITLVIIAYLLHSDFI